MLALGPGGERLVVETASRLARADDEGGNGYWPLGDYALAPDGRHVLLRQNSSVEIYELATGTWTTIDTPDWLAEGAWWAGPDTIVVPNSLSDRWGGQTYAADGMPKGPAGFDISIEWSQEPNGWGPLVRHAGDAAQAYFVSRQLLRPGDNSLASEAVAVQRAGKDTAVLAIPPERGSGRSKGCCAVAGWLDDDTVLYWSRSDTTRLLAWRVGTSEISRVAEVVGWPGSSGFADLTRS